MPDFAREEVLEIAHKLIDANLQGLDLSGANLHKANLIKADLSRADLRRTDLSRAHLHGPDLIGIIMRAADLSEAKYDKNTRFPQGYDPGAGAW